MKCDNRYAMPQATIRLNSQEPHCSKPTPIHAAKDNLTFSKAAAIHRVNLKLTYILLCFCLYSLCFGFNCTGTLSQGKHI
jgi:hypothetical protein